MTLPFKWGQEKSQFCLTPIPWCRRKCDSPLVKCVAEIWWSGTIYGKRTAMLLVLVGGPAELTPLFCMRMVLWTWRGWPEHNLWNCHLTRPRGQNGQAALWSFLYQVLAEKDCSDCGHAGRDVIMSRVKEKVLCLQSSCLFQIQPYISVAFWCQHLKIM